MVPVWNELADGSSEDGVGAGLASFQRLFLTAAPVRAVVRRYRVVLETAGAVVQRHADEY